MEVKYSSEHLKTMRQRCLKMKEYGWDYYFLLPHAQSKDHYNITLWCRDNFELDSVTWHGQQFWFKNEADLMQFKLTWL